MNMTLSCGNCSDCGAYARVNHQGRCQQCVEDEVLQINTALDLTQLKSNITLEEIANALDVDENRVMEWVRKGIIRCIVVEFDCPRCDTHVINRLSCPQCGYEEGAGRVGKEENLKAMTSRMVTVDRRRSNRYVA